MCAAIKETLLGSSKCFSSIE